MQRREILVGGVVGAAALAHGSAQAGTLEDPGETRSLHELQLHDRLARIRTRMARAGARTVARYQRQTPGSEHVPAEVWQTIGNGFGALSVMPSLRRLSEEERARPEVNQLLNDVALHVGTYLLHTYESLTSILAHPSPMPRERLGAALLGLQNHEEDEDFGRSAFVELRKGRQELRETLHLHGPDKFLVHLHTRLEGLVEQARAQAHEFGIQAEESAPLPTTDGAPKSTMAGKIGKGIATLLGALALGLVAIGGICVVAGILVSFSGGYGLCVGVLLAAFGGVVIVVALPIAMGLLAVGTRADGVVKSLDGKRVMVSAESKWGWFATGATFTPEHQPHIVTAGGIRVKGRLTAVPPGGIPNTQAGTSWIAPGLPEFALVARIGNWVGVVVGPGDRVTSAPREGALWLAVNVDPDHAEHDGTIDVTIVL